MKKRFTVTYEIITERSADYGDFAFNGFATRDLEFPRKRNRIPKNPATFTLREIAEFVNGNPPGHIRDCVEPDSSPWGVKNPPRWVSFYGKWNAKMEAVSFSVHPAKSGGITGASRVRLARLARAYGELKTRTV